MKLLKTLLILSTLVFVKNDTAKAYYFQLADLREGIIFKYECKADASKTEYWKLTSKHNTLITEAYNSNLDKYEFFVEAFSNDGSKVTNFVSYHKNESGEVDVVKRRLKDTDVFKWDTNETYNYSAEFIDKTYGQVSFSMHRTFIKETSISIFNSTQTVLKFKCIYRTKIPDSNYDFEYSQYSYYAKGLGLVKMEKTYPDGNTEVLELTKIITTDEWGKMQ